MLNDDVYAFKSDYFSFEKLAPHVLFVKWETKNSFFGQSFTLENITIPMHQWAFLGFLRGLMLDQKEVVGIAKPRQSEGMFIYIDGVLSDPFDEKHIVSARVSEKPFPMTTKNGMVEFGPEGFKTLTN